MFTTVRLILIKKKKKFKDFLPLFPMRKIGLFMLHFRLFFIYNFSYKCTFSSSFGAEI